MTKEKKPEAVQFLFAEDFLNTLLVYRSLWLKGRYGGGKTSLAVILAAWLMSNEHVKRTLTNFPCVLDAPLSGWPTSGGKPELLYDAALIIDETHAFIADRASVSVYAKFLRKTNYYMLMPSVMPPHMRLTGFSAQRIMNCYVYGLPAWVYKWTLRSANVKEEGYFAVWKPHNAFGSYDTKSIPFNDAGISDAIDLTIKYEQWSEETRKKTQVILPEDESRRVYLERVAKGEDPLYTDFVKENSKNAKGKRSHKKSTDDNQDVLDALEDAAESVQTGGEHLEDLSKKVGRKIRGIRA